MAVVVAAAASAVAAESSAVLPLPRDGADSWAESSFPGAVAADD